MQPYIIDCDADPFVPPGWKVLSHKKSGKLTWDLEKVGIYTAPCQRHVMPPLATEVEVELADKEVHNANVLDFLVAHPDALPVSELEWLKDPGAGVVYWGTIYENENGKRCVRCLSMSEDGSLIADFCEVDTAGLMDSNPAAVSSNQALVVEASLNEFATF
jgi:hypothetical protein